MKSTKEASHTLPCRETPIADDGGREAYPSPPNSPAKDSCDLVTAGDASSEEPHSATVPSSDASISINPSKPDTDRSTSKADVTNGRLNMDASALKELFSISSGQCGALTVKESPCTRYIAEGRRSSINSHVDFILVPDQSSPRHLQINLEKLVDLVHCHQHRRGYPRDMRLDEWTTELSNELGLGLASHSASVKRKIELCFGRRTNQCMGTTRANRRCKKHIGGRKAQQCSRAIDEISNAESHSSEMNLDSVLRALAINMHCDIHKEPGSSKRLEFWKKSIKEVLTSASLTSDLSEENTITERSEAHVLVKKQKSTLYSNNSDVILTSSAQSEDCSKNATTQWPDEYDSTSFDIIEKSDCSGDYRTSYSVIREQLIAPLKAVDRKEGYLYIYEVEGNKGFVKTGYTTRTIAERHEEWCFDCNRQPDPLYPVLPFNAVRIPNARRVEALCHRELRHRRVIIYCYGCLKTHEEWFQVSATEAIAVVEKWSAWMQKEPYQADHSLKEKEASQAANMDQYMKDLLD